MIRRVAIIGLGPHNRRIYYPQLERRNIVVALVIDIEGQRESVESFIKYDRVAEMQGKKVAQYTATGPKPVPKGGQVAPAK